MKGKFKMEEKSLKVLANDTTFFNKISNTLTKLLTPTKVGFNSMLITIKRNAVLKSYENYSILRSKNSEKIDSALKKYEESYTLYLEAIDKYIMDSVYKKVKNKTASEFEKRAMSEYYNVVHLKDKDYNEYKVRKQKFLLSLDYESILNNGKDKQIIKFKTLYVERIDDLFKALLKNYSVKLADGIKAKNLNQSELYQNIFSTLDLYAKDILPIKIEIVYKDFEKIRSEYDELDRFDVGKLDEKDLLEKDMLLLAMSRTLFTHSLPLVAAENCYKYLIQSARDLIISTNSSSKKEDIYMTLLKIINNYNEKLLSTKVYWESQRDREEFKKFWNIYCSSSVQDDKEIAILRKEIIDISDETGLKTKKIRNFYKKKLVEFGVMKNYKNSCRTIEDSNYRSNRKIRGRV